MARLSEDTRERILEAARDVYLESGMAGFSMRKVASVVGISATAIYRHFDNKEALLLAVAQTGFELFGQYLFRGMSGATPSERLRLAGEGYLRFGLEHSGYYRVMFMSSAEDFGFVDMPEDTLRKTAPTFQFLVDRVRECIDDGSFRLGDPVSIAASIWSSVHGLVSLYLSGKLQPFIHTEAEFVEFYRESQARTLKGLAT